MTAPAADTICRFAGQQPYLQVALQRSTDDRGRMTDDGGQNAEEFDGLKPILRGYAGPTRSGLSFEDSISCCLKVSPRGNTIALCIGVGKIAFLSTLSHPGPGVVE